MDKVLYLDEPLSIGNVCSRCCVMLGDFGDEIIARVKDFWEVVGAR